MFHSFNASKLKSNLKMAIERINLVTNKKTIAMKKSKREVAEMLSQKQVFMSFFFLLLFALLSFIHLLLFILLFQ
jgi:hypothetical protein